MTGRPAIEVAGLHKAFGDTVVLDGIDLTVREDTVYALLGPNGAGKTTLIRILATLARPDRGRAAVTGHDVVGDPHGVRRAISLTGQYAAVDELLTGEENLRMMARLAGLDRHDARHRAAELLATFDLVDAGCRRVATYSGGMRRRLDLAASLVTAPAVLFLDEPTTGLDARSRQAVWNLVDGLRGRGTSVLLTTQYLEEADRLADRIGVLDGGRIVAEGTPAQLKAQVGVERAELTFATGGELAAAAVALAAPDVEVDEDTRIVRVPTDGSGTHLRRLLGDLADHGVEVAHVSVRRPSLDDVFFALTGSGGDAPARSLESTAP